jgi:hypothetical protein
MVQDVLTGQTWAGRLIAEATGSGRVHHGAARGDARRVNVVESWNRANTVILALASGPSRAVTRAVSACSAW